MVSQLKNELTCFVLLIVRSEASINQMVSTVEKPAEEICPHGTDHPEHRLIYIWDLLDQGLHYIEGSSRNTITIYQDFPLNRKFCWSTKDSLYSSKSHANFQIRSTIKRPSGRKTNIGKV
jgi:hypothetical protein